MTYVRRVDVLVVGAGPAGLAAAARLAAAGAGRVEVLEREAEAGGVPRHCAHGGFGTWTHPLTGPAYARLLTQAAERAGAVIRTGVTVLDWASAEPPAPGNEPDPDPEPAGASEAGPGVPVRGAAGTSAAGTGVPDGGAAGALGTGSDAPDGGAVGLSGARPGGVGEVAAGVFGAGPGAADSAVVGAFGAGPGDAHPVVAGETGMGAGARGRAAAERSAAGVAESSPAVRATTSGSGQGGPVGTTPAGPAGGSVSGAVGSRAGAVVSAVGSRAGTVLTAVGPGGPEIIEARAVVLATGARERPRTARLVPGTRPAGVYTTGELQQAVHLFRQRIGTRAVVVGAEEVSYAAAATVRAAGAEVVALVTEHPRAQTGRARAGSARLYDRIPLLTHTTVTELLGHGRLSGVRVRHHAGRTTVLACDTVVFTGDFVPDHELARRGALALDPGTRGPAVDGALHTSRPGVFAAGNVLHAVERAGTAADEGARVAGAVLDFLKGAPWPERGVPLAVEPPLRWIAPNRITPAAPPARYLLRTGAQLTRPVLQVHQDGRLLHRERPGLWTALPNRTLTLTARWTERVDPKGGEAVVSVG